MDFWFFWGIFRKRWKIILLIAFAAATVVGVYSKLFIRPVYRSTVSLYLGRVRDNTAMERAMSLSPELVNVGTELSLGGQLLGDYVALINNYTLRQGVEDELIKSVKWKKKEDKSYLVTAETGKASSRIMTLNIDSDNAAYSQDVAQIFARKFIEEVPKLVGVQNMQVTGEPRLQPRPISPNIPRNTAAGFLGGFFLTFLFFVAGRMLDRKLWTSDEVENVLNVPVVGTVHKDKEYSLTKGNPFLFTSKDTSAQDRSQIAEDFRVFRVNLINKKPAGKQDGSVIAVTSTNAKEGKTFCTANLGAALAEAGYKVLLVDCDTGDRGLQSYFGKANEKGLMNILAGEANFEDSVKRNLNNLNMDVLFCGDKNLNSANLMVSPKFRELMGKLKQQYDYAFLDVSCHLGTADIVSAGSSADSVLLLVRAGKSEGAVIKQTADALKRANLDISGVILNGVEDD